MAEHTTLYSAASFYVGEVRYFAGERFDKIEEVEYERSMAAFARRR